MDEPTHVLPRVRDESSDVDVTRVLSRVPLDRDHEHGTIYRGRTVEESPRRRVRPARTRRDPAQEARLTLVLASISLILTVGLWILVIVMLARS